MALGLDTRETGEGYGGGLNTWRVWPLRRPWGEKKLPTLCSNEPSHKRIHGGPAMTGPVRRNFAHVTPAERLEYIAAVLQADLNTFSDGVSYWDKQDQIHQVTHNHDGNSFVGPPGQLRIRPGVTGKPRPHSRSARTIEAQQPRHLVAELGPRRGTLNLAPLERGGTRDRDLKLGPSRLRDGGSRDQRGETGE